MTKQVRRVGVRVSGVGRCGYCLFLLFFLFGVCVFICFLLNNFCTQICKIILFVAVASFVNNEQKDE